MKWKDKIVTDILSELFKLKKSDTKLNWYVMQFNLLQGPENDLVKLDSKTDLEIEEKIIEFKNTLLSYDDMLKNQVMNSNNPFEVFMVYIF
jgi:hypothetical protein